MEFLSDIIYTLKREFQTTIIIIKQESSQRNYNTGKIELSATEYEVDKAVALPKLLRPLGTNKLSEEQRSILIDLDDISFSVDRNDKVKLEGVTWDIVDIRTHQDKILELIVQHV